MTGSHTAWRTGAHIIREVLLLSGMRVGACECVEQTFRGTSRARAV